MSKRPVGDRDVDEMVSKEIYQTARGQADLELAKMKEQVFLSHQLGQISGRAQAFSAMKLIAEFLEWKHVAQIIDNDDYLKLPGVTSIELYFETLGIGRASAYRNLKIARTLTQEEVSLLGQIGFTRKDLLNYSSLPEDKRLEIREGKVINLETASREEIKDLIEQVVIETRQAKEDAEDTVKAAEKVSRDKEKTINKQAKQLALYDRSAKQKDLLPEEDAILGKIEELETSLHGYALCAENIFDALQENPFAAGVAAFITLMDNIKMRVSHFREVAVTDLAPSGMLPEEEWVPPPLRTDLQG